MQAEAGLLEQCRERRQRSPRDVPLAQHAPQVLARCFGPSPAELFFGEDLLHERIRLDHGSPRVRWVAQGLHRSVDGAPRGLRVLSVRARRLGHRRFRHCRTVAAPPPTSRPPPPELTGEHDSRRDDTRRSDRRDGPAQPHGRSGLLLRFDDEDLRGQRARDREIGGDEHEPVGCRTCWAWLRGRAANRLATRDGHYRDQHQQADHDGTGSSGRSLHCRREYPPRPAARRGYRCEGVCGRVRAR